MDELKRQGRTILFVSHEMTDVLRVASRVIWLEHGRVRAEGDPTTVVEAYLAAAHPPA